MHILLLDQLTANYFADRLKEIKAEITISEIGELTFLWKKSPPKYQNSPFKVAPQPS